MIFGIEISTPEFSLGKKQGTSLKLSGLKIGQMIRAKVLDLMPEGRAQLLVFDRKIIAKTDLPMARGDELTLTVTREGDNLGFKPVLRTASSFDFSKQGGPNLSPASLFARVSANLDSLLKIEDPGVKTILDTLSLKSGQRDDRFLPRLLENLGLTLEKKIGEMTVSGRIARGDSGIIHGHSKSSAGLTPMMATLIKTDLKAKILNLISSQGETASASKPLKNAAAVLESLQQLNTQSGDSNRFLFPFPIAAGQFFDFGQLFIDTGKKGGEEKKENRIINVAFLMNMTALGRLRADFSFFRQKVTGGFLLEDQATCNYLSSLMPELKGRLASIGFTAGRITCKVAPENSFSPNDLVQSLAAGHRDTAHSLDLVI